MRAVSPRVFDAALTVNHARVGAPNAPREVVGSPRVDVALHPGFQRHAVSDDADAIGGYCLRPQYRVRHAEQPPQSIGARRILALCLGGIGDTVLSFAALRDLRRACPDDHITALAMWRQSADLLEDLGVFDEVLQHNFQCERPWRSLWKAVGLRRRHFDASLLAFPANRFEYNAVSFLLGARRRYGHSYLRGGDRTNLRFLLTDRVDQKLGRHNVDENRALVAEFIGRPTAEPPDIRLGPIAPEYHAYAIRMLEHLHEPMLGIHPGCSTYKGLAAKRWPVERFGELCRRARTELGVHPVVFGMPNEIDLKLRIQAICPEVFFAHGPTIRHTAALIARCACFVSNDSALAHIASALDVPVVMLCGPTDAREVGPYNGTGRVITAGIICAPCFRVGRRPMRCHHYREYQSCMKQIGIDSVLDAVTARVAGAAVPSRGVRHMHNIHRGVRLPVLGSPVAQGVPT